jgi:dienelactone hydrolase
VLGARTLAKLHKRVGQRVTVNGGRPMTIVGSAVFAGFSMGGGTATDLGTGAAVAASVLSEPNPPASSLTQVSLG